MINEPGRLFFYRLMRKAQILNWEQTGSDCLTQNRREEDARCRIEKWRAGDIGKEGAVARCASAVEGTANLLLSDLPRTCVTEIRIPEAVAFFTQTQTGLPD
jgi:hypothetical protein